MKIIDHEKVLVKWFYTIELVIVYNPAKRIDPNEHKVVINIQTDNKY